MSIVKRLGGSSAAKVMHLFGLCKDFEKKGTGDRSLSRIVSLILNTSRTIRVQKQENVSPLIPINCPINRSVKETKRQRDKESKRRRVKETKGRRDKESKGQRDKETKSQRDEETKRLRE